MGDLRVRLLGRLAVEGTAGVLPGPALGAARDRLLLAVLATAAGSVVARDVLIDVLWPRQQPREPNRALTSLVSRLRRALGPDGPCLRSGPAGYLLDCETDLGDLERCVAGEEFEAALVLLGSQYLAGETAGEWVDARRRDLARRRVDLLVQAGSAALRRDDYETALNRFQAAVAEDNLREDGHRGVAEALARSGREAEALRAYEHCRLVLRTELGASPSPETVALYEQILRRSLPPPRPKVPSAEPAGRELPFLGRRRELAELRSVLQAPWPAALAVVAGEAGIGKTRLVGEALDDLAGARLVEHKCFALTASIPYALLDGLLDADLSGGPPPGGEARLAAEVVERISGLVPLVVFVDDLQWADASSLRVLALALRHLGGGAMTMVATLREEETGAGDPPRQFVELAARLGSLRRFVLAPLQPQDLEAVGFTYHDWERTGGHPLFLTEHARGATERDLAAIVTERAAHRGVVATETLSAAAVLDRPATLDDLSAVTGLSRAEVRGAAFGLAAEALLCQDRGSWRVRHDLIATLVRHELDQRTRRELHRRALEGLHGASPGELVRHALGAAAWPRALEECLAAGEAALAAFADQEALAHFETGLLLAREHRVGDPHQRFRLSLGHARALITCGRASEASSLLGCLPASPGREEFERLAWASRAEWFTWRPSAGIPPAERALGIARGLADDELVGEAHGLLGNCHASLGDLDLGLEHLGAARAVFERLGREPPALVWLRLATIEHHRGQEPDALVTLDRLRAAARAERDESYLVMECWLRALVLGGLGRYGEALATLAEMARIGRGEEAYARTKEPNTRGWLLFDIGLVQEAIDANEESLEVIRNRAGDVAHEPEIQTLLNLAENHLAAGNPDVAAGYLAEAEPLAVVGEVARYRFRNRLEVVRGLLALEAGHPDDALAAAAAARRMAAGYDAPRNTVRADLVGGQALARLDRPDQALARFRAAARVAARRGFAALAEEAHRRAGRTAGSAYHLRQADGWRARIAASVEGTGVRPRFRDH